MDKYEIGKIYKYSYSGEWFIYKVTKIKEKIIIYKLLNGSKGMMDYIKQNKGGRDHNFDIGSAVDLESEPCTKLEILLCG